MANMEFPICNNSYSSECDVPDVAFLRGVMQFAHRNMDHNLFFVGLCFFCNNPGTRDDPLQRCGGCQLVGYCSKHCQKSDRSAHKGVCKEFPVVNGHNALYARGPWKQHIRVLRERAAQLPNAQAAAAMSIFRNPRICRTCGESRPDRLTDCECACVSYCSKRCLISDKKHKKYCLEIGNIAIVHSFTFESHVNMECANRWNCLRDCPVCEKFNPVFSWDEIFPIRYRLCSINLDKSYNMPVGTHESLDIEPLSSPMSLLYALQALPERRLGRGRRFLEDQTTLEVHVVNSSPIFDSEPWEVLMHRLPALKQLNIVFIMQGKVHRPSFGMNIGLSLLRCEDCDANNRVITYSVHQMMYHMFFSSPQYTEPDIVVVYGTAQEMPSGERDAIHSEISYRNMTDSNDAVLVLMDATKDLVKQGARSVNAARPVIQLVAPQVNPLRGYGSVRADVESDVAIVNEKYYFTCLKRK